MPPLIARACCCRLLLEESHLIRRLSAAPPASDFVLLLGVGQILFCFVFFSVRIGKKLRKTSVPHIEGGAELFSLFEKLLEEEEEEEEEEKDDHWRGLLVFQRERERESCSCKYNCCVCSAS
jgi:hypothetical protein